MNRLNLPYFICKNSARIAAWLYLRHTGHGKQWVPEKGAFLLAANHASFLDPVLAGTQVPRDIGYLARSTLFRPAPWGALLRKLNTVPIDRGGVGKQAIRVVQERLREGLPVLMFPEGTRSAEGRLETLRSGVVRIARTVGVPILPAWISGSARAWGRGQPWPRPRKTSIRFGPPIDVAADSDEQELLVELRERFVTLASASGDAALVSPAPVAERDQSPHLERGSAPPWRGTGRRAYARREDPLPEIEFFPSIGMHRAERKQVSGAAAPPSTRPSAKLTKASRYPFEIRRL